MMRLDKSENVRMKENNFFFLYLIYLYKSLKNVKIVLGEIDYHHFDLVNDYKSNKATSHKMKSRRAKLV